MLHVARLVLHRLLSCGLAFAGAIAFATVSTAQPPGQTPPPPAPAPHPAGVVPATPQEPRPAPPAATPSTASPAAAPQAQGAGGGDAAAGAQEPEAGDEPAADEPAKPPRPGIRVDDILVQSFCGRCHHRDEQNLMTRISYVRKSPEGWAETIKRMGRLHGLQLTADTAKDIVRSLANSHGLARSEAERGLYESERRVHWSEEHLDQDFRNACAQCHTLGRVLLQRRDPEEWQLLRATHVAMFPLARGQMGGGPPEDERPRSGPPPGAATTSTARGRAAPSEDEANQRRRNPSQDVGDRVLGQLAKDQPLFTPEWESWAQNRRDVPLAGTWTVTGHETGRGDLAGMLTLLRTGKDEYEATWRLSWSDGSTAERTGKGLLYAGYSWRGRSRAADAVDWREVLLLDDQWQELRGRLFSGNYDELGADVTLHRDDGRPHIVALGNGAVEVPSTARRVDVYTNAPLPPALAATDFFAGEGVTITAADRVDDRHAVLTLDVAAGTALGTRKVAFGANPGGADLVLYDTVDYVRIRPLRGLARVGGARHPRQLERFEAYAMHRGKDEKPYTDDDVDLFQVRPTWALAEFAVRDDDDDLQYVGTLDAATGVFTPNVDGPNPQRKWQANNVGDVFVTCTIELDVPVRPEPPKAKAAKPSASGAAETGEQQPSGREPPAGGQGGAPPVAPPAGEPAAAQPQPDEAHAQEGAAEVAEAPAPPVPPARERRTFRARSHLVVTVPLYARWQVLEWEDR